MSKYDRPKPSREERRHELESLKVGPRPMREELTVIYGRTVGHSPEPGANLDNLIAEILDREYPEAEKQA